MRRGVRGAAIPPDCTIAGLDRSLLDNGRYTIPQMQLAITNSGFIGSTAGKRKAWYIRFITDVLDENPAGEYRSWMTRDSVESRNQQQTLYEDDSSDEAGGTANYAAINLGTFISTLIQLQYREPEPVPRVPDSSFMVPTEYSTVLKRTKEICPISGEIPGIYLLCKGKKKDESGAEIPADHPHGLVEYGHWKSSGNSECTICKVSMDFSRVYVNTEILKLPKKKKKTKEMGTSTEADKVPTDVK